MRRIAAFILCLCVCISLCGCGLGVNTDSPPTSASTRPTTAPKKVREISPGKVEIRGCTVDASSVITNTILLDGRKQPVCMLSVSVRNNTKRQVLLRSLCQIRVKQNNRICMEVDMKADSIFDADKPVEANGWSYPMICYKISNTKDPIQVQILYQGSVLSEFTYKPPQ